jgi:hypothetical protein
MTRSTGKRKGESVRCKHCGKRIVQDSAGRGWRHGETGPYACSDTYATPRETKREAGR